MNTIHRGYFIDNARASVGVELDELRDRLVAWLRRGATLTEAQVDSVSTAHLVADAFRAGWYARIAHEEAKR